MAEASWYIRNDDVQKNIQIEYISKEIARFSANYFHRMQIHENNDIHLILSCSVQRRNKAVQMNFTTWSGIFTALGSN